MVASRDLSDVVILDRRTGRRMGRAIRVDYRPGNKYIGGIVYRRYGLISRRALLPLSGVRTMSKRVILADPEGGGREAAVSAEPPGSIYLTDGRYLGELHSLMIDDNTGLVEALIVRTSLLDDIRRGFLWLSDPSKLVPAANHIILLT